MNQNIFANVEFHNTLNPKIWTTDEKLRPEVKDKLNEIVDEFAEFIDLPLTIIDAHIVGSNASYNYTQYSDLDLHLIVNFARIDADPTITEALMWADKKLFNDEYDLTIRGINVEVYVEDVNSGATSNGIYSLFEDRWIKHPQPIQVDVDIEEVYKRVNELEPEINSVIINGDSEAIADEIDKLYLMRKNSLADAGEYGVGNLAFKELRNMGLIDDLKEALTERRSTELSIQGAVKIK